jgi:hypothetical protein
LQNIQIKLQQRNHSSLFAAGSFNMGCLSIRLFGFISLKKRAKATQVASELETKADFF